MKKITINLNLSKIALEGFRANCEHADAVNYKAYKAARAALLDIWTGLFTDLQEGKTDYFYYWTGANIVIYSRSIKEDGKIQRSTYWNRGGEYIALSDLQIADIRDADKRGAIKDNVIIFTGSNKSAGNAA